MNPMIYTCTIDTPLGDMTAAVKEDALSGLWFIGQKHYPSQRAQWYCQPNHPVLNALREHLADYFSGKSSMFDIRLDPPGSPFQKAVWNILLKIPMGKVVTYGQIARCIAKKRGVNTMSAQAVGGAVGRNPVSILIPCHRVIGSDNSLTGYAGGLEKKMALLQIEKSKIRFLTQGVIKTKGDSNT